MNFDREKTPKIEENREMYEVDTHLGLQISRFNLMVLVDDLVKCFNKVFNDGVG